MGELFFIADLHLGHKGIIEFESTKPYRPFKTIEEHDEEVISRWNSRVNKNDSVWVLGDFCIGKKHLEKAARLKGTKRLVMGNHDLYAATDYLKYFTRLVGAVKIHDVLLTHVPVHPSQFSRYVANIHGHLHTTRVTDAHGLVDHKYINVSAEQVDLTPISWDELKLKHSVLP